VVSDPAPATKENGDLYINNEEGEVGSSWIGIAGEQINEAVAVGWSETNNRWYMLGDIASAAVLQVREGTGIDVEDDSNPAKPVVSIDRTEVDKWYAEFNHNHEGLYLEEEVDPTVPQHVKDISTNDISRWDEAHGWGDHSQEGYLKSGDIPDVDQSDKISKTDPNDQQVVSNFKSLKNITAAKFIGDGSSLTNITTNQLADVSSATAKKDDFLIHDGNNWVAEAFHIDTELTYQGAWNLTAAPPTEKKNGDLYINNTNGTVHSGWTGIGGTAVREGNVVGWAASKNRWYLLGDLASSSVIEVKGGTGITVNSNEAAKPIVNLDLATASNRGGAKIGFPASGKNYPVQLNGSEQMYVSVPWTDTDNVPDGTSSGQTLQWQQGNGWVISQNFFTDDLADETAVSTKTFDFYGNGNALQSKATFHVNTSVNGVMEATTIKKYGGTASQLLCADGSVVDKGDVGAGSGDVDWAIVGSDPEHERVVIIGEPDDTTRAEPDAIAIGFDSEARYNAIVIGNGAEAGDGGIALGNGADAGEDQLAISPNIENVYFPNAKVQAVDYLDADGNSIIGAGADLTGYATQAWVTTNHYAKTETKKNVVMTEAQYNALGSKDAETIYFLT